MLGINMVAGARIGGSGSGGAHDTRPAVLLLGMPGQSNDVGVVAYTGSLRQPTNTFIFNSAGNAFVPLVCDPAGTLSTNLGDASTHMGWEMAFAERFRVLHPNRPLYIIKRAVDGTALDIGWLPPSGANYTAMLTYLAAGLAALPSGYEIIGHVCTIGETDGAVQQDSEDWAFNFCNIINLIRRNVTLKYNYPIIVCSTVDNGAGVMTYESTVLDRQAYAVSWLNGAAIGTPCNLSSYVDTTAFARTASNVHHTEAGYNAKGTALANLINSTVWAAASGIQIYNLPYVGPLYVTDSAGVTRDGSNDISIIKDIAPSRWNMTQSGSAALKPNYDATGLNGVPAAKFVRSDSSIITAGNHNNRTWAIADGQFELFCVCSRGAASVNQVVFGKYGGSGDRQFYLGMLSSRLPTFYFSMNSSGTAQRAMQAAALTDDNSHLFRLRYDGSVDTETSSVPDRVKMFKDGVQQTLTSIVHDGSIGDIYASGAAHIALGGAADSSGAGQSSLFHDGWLQLAGSIGTLLTTNEATAMELLFNQKVGKA